MIASIRQGLKEDGYTVSVSQVCRWFDIPRRTAYYRPTKKTPVVQERFAQPIKQMIEESPRSATARWHICWTSTRTPSNAFSSSNTQTLASTKAARRFQATR